MIAAKHTQGPFATDGLTIKATAGGWDPVLTIATLGHLVPQPERQANGHLFAAADLMLDRLESFNTWALQVAARYDLPQGIRSAAAMHADECAHAIAKATGSAS